NYGWGAVRMPFRIMLPQFWHIESYMPENLQYENVLRHLPLIEMDVYGSGTPVKHYRDWIEHQSYDAYWKAISDEERFHQIEVPAYNMGGWFDIFVDGTVNGYKGLRRHGATEEAREGTRLIIGPWGHGVTQSYGGVDFGEAAVIDLFDLQLQFYDRHLKGLDLAIKSEKPVELFYMGANQWRGEDDWPIPGTEYRKMYFSGDGSANSVRGDGSLQVEPASQNQSDSFLYDPLHAVPTTGGNNCCGTPTQAGPRDQRPIERREDVLVYTSPVLSDPVTVAGPVALTLFASTDGQDTDWMIKLVDVYPDGFSMPISEGILRARFRKGLDEMELLIPDQVYDFTINLTPTANVFLPGHKIRVDITSSNFPQFDRNPNTGLDLGMSAKTRIAKQTVFHGGTRPSHITLPVVPMLVGTK
ncbi:MAG: CocE/NonD family hydrolase, partial [Saprospiraceae bacterium]|nr:CocE/NonD family hydrolase [Saprospiraceae bacterium]